MDYVLLGFVVIYFFVGMKKGFVSMIFSVAGVVISFFVAYYFCGRFAQVGNNLFGAGVQRFLTNLINGVVSGKFSTMTELFDAIVPTKFGKLFGVVIERLLKNIEFDGSLTAGAILSPTLSILFFKVVSFIFLFFVSSLILKILNRTANFLIKKLGISTKNRFMGGVFGLFKGVVMFFVLFVVLTAIANFTLSESLQSFVQSGKISTTLYNKYITKIISLFY